MPDEIDFASERYEAWLDFQIRDRRAQVAKRTCLPVGICYNCEEPVPGDAIYCDDECRDDHEKRRHHAQVNPR